MNHFLKSQLSRYGNNASIVKYVCIVLLASSVLNSCSTYRINRLKNKSIKEWKAYQWNEMKRSTDKQGAEWIIHSRKVEGTNLLEYKIEGEIASTPEACVVAFWQHIHHQADDINKYPTYDIMDESDSSFLTYVIHNEPFPFKDTEMSLRYLFSNYKECDREVRWNEAWDENSIPPSKKLNRVVTFRGSWNFSEVSENHSKAVNIVQFDPKKMPKWLVNPMVTKFLKKGFENIEQTTSK